MRASLEEIDCEFIARGRNASGAPLGETLSCEVELKRACAPPPTTTKRTKQNQNETDDAEDENSAGVLSVATRVWRMTKDAFARNGAIVSTGAPARSVARQRRGRRKRRAALAWHGGREILASVDEGGRCVMRRLDGASAASLPMRDEDGEDGDDASVTLRHRAHGKCASMAWRPKHGRALALCGPTGTCVWTRERRGTRASSAVSSETGALSPIDAAKVRALTEGGMSGKTSGYRWRCTLYNERGAHNAGPTGPPGGALAAECVAWSPDGRILVASSRSSRVIHTWDVSEGLYTPLGAGVAGVTEVAFSACGGYLIAAHAGEGFSVWQCDDWTCRKWSTNGREVTALAWGTVQNTHGDAPVALIATAGTTKLSAVHLSPRDSITEIAAHVLPLELPTITAEGGVDADGDDDCGIVDMDWDASSSRLALALVGGARDGSVAVYATRTSNIVSGSLIGHFDTRDENTGARVPACALTISTPKPASRGSLRAQLAVAFDNGDVARVPLTYANPK